MKGSRALEAKLAAAAGQLVVCAASRDRAADRAGAAAGLGGRDGVQAVRERVQIRLGCLRGPQRWPSSTLQQLRTYKACSERCKAHVRCRRSSDGAPADWIATWDGFDTCMVCTASASAARAASLHLGHCP